LGTKYRPNWCLWWRTQCIFRVVKANQNICFST
jgi:hypothetical protein